MSIRSRHSWSRNVQGQGQLYRTRVILVDMICAWRYGAWLLQFDTHEASLHHLPPSSGDISVIGTTVSTEDHLPRWQRADSVSSH